MQCFSNVWGGNNRTIVIKTMTTDEAEDFFIKKYPDMDEDERKKRMRELQKRIKKGSKSKHEISNWILAVTDKGGKVVGKFEVIETEDEKVALSIEMTSETNLYKYTTDAIDEIIKISKNQKCFKEIELTESRETSFYKTRRSITENKLKIA